MIPVLVFGNPEIKEDSLALEIADELNIAGFKFIRCSSPEQILDFQDFYILDVVKGIDKVIFITDPHQLKKQGLTTLHDFDLGFYLKLLKEIGQIKEVKIIGIPVNGNKEIIKQQIYDQLTSKK